ncbi:MAG: 16S rRNA (guanine(966)-N(2))-methyltransferase RsmD [Thermodesulfobacteriota bacterium]|nr:16S rRNA (guanine(966)-N(2))-methyltransferase RsmD [Thermodesulfobacteriota bacterium]
MAGFRVIGGTLKGTPLASPKGLAVRPTAARVREAMANILQHRIPGAGVLDLFAGTGALGIEALSRGACSAVFIDNHPAALAVIQKNITRCGLEAATRTILSNPVRSLKCLAGTDKPFDLVFMDPPYGKKVVSATLTRLYTDNVLAPDALVVVETGAPKGATGDSRPHPFGEGELPGCFSLSTSRKYGKTLVHVIQYVVK